MSKLSGVYIKVKVLFKHSLDPDEAEEFVNECSYSIEHPFYKIIDTEWVDYEEIVEK